MKYLLTFVFGLCVLFGASSPVSALNDTERTTNAAILIARALDSMPLEDRESLKSFSIAVVTDEQLKQRLGSKRFDELELDRWAMFTLLPKGRNSPQTGDMIYIRVDSVYVGGAIRFLNEPSTPKIVGAMLLAQLDSDPAKAEKKILKKWFSSDKAVAMTNGQRIFPSTE